jgi:hypothetical protein
MIQLSQLHHLPPWTVESIVQSGVAKGTSIDKPLVVEVSRAISRGMPLNIAIAADKFLLWNLVYVRQIFTLLTCALATQRSSG